MADLFTASGTTVSISNAAIASTVDSAVEFAALSWVAIGNIESVGEFGDDATIVSGAVIGDGRVRKSKGARDAGTMAIVCFDAFDDVGQLKLIEAEATNDNWGFRVVLPNGPTASFTDSTLYFRALVTGKRLNVGANDNLVRRTFNAAINSSIIEVPADTV